MARLARYDPSSVIGVWGATPILEGAAAGTFVTLERIERTWSLRKGVDGEGARVRTNNFAGAVRFTLRNGSRINTFLSAQLQADELTGVIHPPLLFKDFSGLTIWASPLSWLDGWTRDSFGTSEENREWTIICDPLIPFPGGSPSV